jgi:branched-chain amino acid aminotransferase
MSRIPSAVWNGRIVPRSEVHIAADDRGFLAGDGVFETIRIEAGVALFLDLHLQRLAAGLERLSMPSGVTAQDVRHSVQKLLAADPDAARRGRLRITVTRGSEPQGPSEPGAPTAVLTLDPWPAPPETAGSHGVAIEMSRQMRVAHPLHSIKSTSYAWSAWQRREARHLETFDVVQCNERGFLAEGSFTNLFLVDAAGVLRTPAPGDGCLPGITRGVVLELARIAAMPYREGEVERAALHAASEAFLTSSLRGMVPVRSVDGHDLPAPCPGVVTARLRDAYVARVRQEIERPRS